MLSAASLQRLTTPYKDDYAFGLIVRTQEGHKQIWHNGGIDGFNTSMAYYPESKVVVIVLANVNGPTPDASCRNSRRWLTGENVQLPGERKEVLTVSGDILARYGAFNAMAPGTNMVVSRQDNQLFAKLANQPAFPIFPESETMFFLKVVDAQIEFPRDEKTPASQLILHQNGRDMKAKRLDDAEAKKAADAAAAFDKRFKDQTAAPGSEAALRRMIEELRTGKPNYDLMSVNLANLTRQQLPQLQSTIAGLGALQTVTFKAVGPAVSDIYEVKFEKGALEYRIWLAPDGKVDNANVRARAVVIWHHKF